MKNYWKSIYGHSIHSHLLASQILVGIIIVIRRCGIAQSASQPVRRATQCIAFEYREKGMSKEIHTLENCFIFSWENIK